MSRNKEDDEKREWIYIGPSGTTRDGIVNEKRW